MVFSFLISFFCFLLWTSMYWASSTDKHYSKFYRKKMITHTSLTLTDFSESWCNAIIGEDEQALKKGAFKAKSCSTVEGEIYMSENRAFSLTRKRWVDLQEQTTFCAEGTTLAGSWKCENEHIQGAVLLSDTLTKAFSTQTSFLLGHHPLFMPSDVILQLIWCVWEQGTKMAKA